ncbi:MAG: HAD hydrolase-like protein [Micrococcales bacterium]|nr:HAD hydrolase-like protein [Micrococcales bacterium]
MAIVDRYTHIIWDWNGTLLDDLDWCLTCINTMLARRNLPLLDSTEDYRQVFGFPIKDYYQRVGFDFTAEPFEVLADEYIELYNSAAAWSLFPDAEKALEITRRYGLVQVILSAQESKALQEQVKACQVDAFFDAIVGLSDNLAASKLAVGQAYFRQAKPGAALMIGDTTHDKAVAEGLGADCILVAQGHHSEVKLAACGVPVFPDLTGVLGYLQD